MDATPTATKDHGGSCTDSYESTVTAAATAMAKTMVKTITGMIGLSRFGRRWIDAGES